MLGRRALDTDILPGVGRAGSGKSDGTPGHGLSRTVGTEGASLLFTEWTIKESDETWIITLNNLLFFLNIKNVPYADEMLEKVCDYHYLDVVNELFSEQIESYESVSQAFTPDFNSREYYEYDDNEYVLLESIPDDWETNWWSYFIKDITINYYRKIKLPAYITSAYFEDGSGTITKSPQDLHWYELDQDGHFSLSTNTDIGSELLDEIENSKSGVRKA